MISFRCPKCGNSYRFPDTKAGAKFVCGNETCRQRLKVPDPPQPDPATILGEAAPPPARRPTPAVPPPPPRRPIADQPRVPPPKPQPQVLASAARPSRKWYYEYKGAAVGPVGEKDLRAAAANRALRPDARVWTEGMPDWQPAVAAVPRLFEGVEEAAAGWGFQKAVAVILATAAVASALALGGVYVVKGRKPAAPPAAARAPSAWPAAPPVAGFG
ncbi:MAG: hypothetical protein C0501_11180 [Isosphaera sp.]|nr:hypothetical protein [Isosphaera sp.]